MNMMIKVKEYPEVEIGDEKAIMNIDTGKYLILNEIGSVIWAEIKSSNQTIESVVSKLTSEYDVSKEQCETEVKTFVDELIDNGIASMGD